MLEIIQIHNTHLQLKIKPLADYEKELSHTQAEFDILTKLLN